MDDAKYFSVSTFSNFFYYHPFGNTPPENLLQSITRPTTNPQVLLLGCGDLRSCFFTIWSNFYPKHLRHFKGVHFVLNDSSAAVLARNIIFLYLSFQMPLEHSDRVKWVASFWSIWYCHELLPHHKELLMNALSQLIKWSDCVEKWSKSIDNPLRLIVQFATMSTLSKIRKAWEMWYHDTSTIEKTRKSRAEYFKTCNAELFQHPMRQLFKYFGGILFKNLSLGERKSMKSDLNDYYKDGVAFAEDVLELPKTNLKSVNSTFIVRSDGVYNLPCNFTPYRCFFFAFQFSPKHLEHLNYSDFPLMVKDDQFTNHPLLANCVQLFSIWIRSCAEIISQPQHDILFTFQCSDALEFCQQLHKPCPHLPQQFDAIYTSNLFDYVSPLSLVLSAMPILKSNGSLFTDALAYSSNSNTSTEYLEKQFGFECKYLQLLCGVRCIGYENEYSDTVSVKPVPYSQNIDIGLGVHAKSFVWRHVTTQMPLKQVTENHFAKMWGTLNNSITNLMTCLYDYKKYNCSGTVMLLLQSFALQFDKEYNCCSHQFWQPLCSLLLKQTPLQYFLTSLQTQALLHNVHLHLLVSQKDCPLCNNKPVLQSIKQLSFTVQEKLTKFFAPDGRELKFFIIIHNISLIGIVTNQFWQSQHPEYSNSLHILDTINGKINTDGKLEITFFCPVNFFQKDYYLSLLSSNKDVIVCKEMSICEVVDKDLFSFYQLNKPYCCQYKTQLSFGVILQHSGDENCFETIVSLSDKTMGIIKKKPLTTVQQSDSTVRIKANDHFIDVLYPYSVEYDKITIKLSRSQKTITVLANHTSHCIYNEDPVFVVNPENLLSLPTMPISKNDAISFCKWQSLPKLNDYGQFHPNPGQDELDLKQSILHLFMRTETHYCCIDKNDEKVRQIKCLILILNRVFDLQNKVPALDILYCHSMEIMTNPIALLGFMQDIPAGPIHIWVNKAETQLFNKILDHFAKSTVATLPVGNKTYNHLVKLNVQHHFSRAVIYPLYPNLDEGTAGPLTCQALTSYLLTECSLPDDLQGSLPNWLSILKVACSGEEDKCSYCKCYKDHLRKCSRCKLVQYCNQDCQRNHWKTHKPHCIAPQ